MAECHDPDRAITIAISSSEDKTLFGSSVLYQNMLAQWKSDGSISRKCLDRNEDMYGFFGLIAILSSGRI